MTQVFSAKIHTPIKFFLSVLAIVLSLASPSYADRRSEARAQFERAVRMRTALEEKPERERTLALYKQTVAAYQRVYLITPQAEEVTPALIAEAELYQQMAQQFDEKYYQSAIDTYNFLLKQYPETRYRSAAIFAIAQIQKDDLGQAEAAEVAFKDFLKRFPKSEKAPDARLALKEISDAREEAKRDQLHQRSAIAGHARSDDNTQALRERTGESRRALMGAGAREPHHEGGRAAKSSDGVDTPLDDEQAPLVASLAQAEAAGLFGQGVATEAIEVRVQEDATRGRQLAYEGERRAGDGSAAAEAAGERFGEESLARAQRALEQDEVARFEEAGDGSAEAPGFLARR